MFRSLILTTLLLGAVPASRGAQRGLDERTFSALQSAIRPQTDESQWAKVPWLINLKDARERAADEDKPIFLWRSGGGDVLGRT